MNEGRGRERHRNPDPPSRKASRISSTSPSVKSEFPEPQEVVCWLSCMHHMRLSLRQLWALGGTGPGLPSLVQPHHPPLASTAAASDREEQRTPLEVHFFSGVGYLDARPKIFSTSLFLETRVKSRRAEFVSGKERLTYPPAAPDHALTGRTTDHLLRCRKQIQYQRQFHIQVLQHRHVPAPNKAARLLRRRI
jgi:hypothetical protein